MLADVLPWLRCPLCTGDLAAHATALTCPNGHTFDVARQGYVNLLTAAAPAGADTPAMVAARDEVLRSGLFDQLTAAVTATATGGGGRGGPGPAAGALVVDVGAGTGHYLAAVLDRTRGPGLALDIAKAAVRRAARAHPRIGAAVCDIWRGLPVADGGAGLVLDVFAPRNPAEFARVLRPDGRLVVVTPEPDHLGELVEPLGLLGVHPGKQARLDRGLADLFHLEHQADHRGELRVDHAGTGRLVAMGPSAFHIAPADLADRMTRLPDPVSITVHVRLGVYRPRTG